MKIKILFVLFLFLAAVIPVAARTEEGGGTIHLYRPSHWSGVVFTYDPGSHHWVGVRWGGGFCRPSSYPFCVACDVAGTPKGYALRLGGRLGDVTLEP